MTEVRGDYKTRFQPIQEVELAKQPVSVALPLDIDQAVRSHPDRSKWLRRVITEAAYKEGLVKQTIETE